MFKRNAIIAATLTVAAACGSGGAIVETGPGAAISAAGPGGTGLYTNEWAFEPVPITEPVAVPVQCSSGDTTLYTSSCPFEAADPAFDPATGPGSNSLDLGE